MITRDNISSFLIPPVLKSEYKERKLENLNPITVQSRIFCGGL
jgi:hypothetical protein